MLHGRWQQGQKNHPRRPPNLRDRHGGLNLRSISTRVAHPGAATGCERSLAPQGAEIGAQHGLGQRPPTARSSRLRTPSSGPVIRNHLANAPNLDAAHALMDRGARQAAGSRTPS
jgi:hypothetical protein